MNIFSTTQRYAYGKVLKRAKNIYLQKDKCSRHAKLFYDDKQAINNMLPIKYFLNDNNNNINNTICLFKVEVMS